MKRNSIIILANLVIMILFLNYSCEPDYKFEYDLVVTDIPANLENLNSVYDDYNSNLPYPAMGLSLFYSSNQTSGGDHFDILCRNIDISYHEQDDIVNFTFPVNSGLSRYENKVLSLINTSYDEFGPYSMNRLPGWDYFFYANNEGGDFEIKFVYTSRSDWGYDGQERIYGPFAARQINSDSADYYPTFNQEANTLYFCSDREGDSFDVYSLVLPSSTELHEFLLDSGSVEITRSHILSSKGNDKCPYITENLLVFASDREGGFGGFDLYYSIYSDSGWSEPVNFGSKINSSADEYRPIAFTLDYEVDVMIFSSNRPGGKGGYDLYAVQIEDLITFDPSQWLK